MRGEQSIREVLASEFIGALVTGSLRLNTASAIPFGEHVQGAAGIEGRFETDG